MSPSDGGSFQTGAMLGGVIFVAVTLPDGVIHDHARITAVRLPGELTLLAVTSNVTGVVQVMRLDPVHAAELFAIFTPEPWS